MISGSPQHRAYRPYGAFRFVLAMLVLLQHSLLLLPPSHRTTFYELELGAVAVSVFFALSGFIVAEATTRFYAERPLAFLANRMLRVIPPYLLALALSVAVQSWLFAIGRLVPLDSPLLGTPWQPRVILAALCELVPGLPTWRISSQTFSFIPFAWTLRIEFAFYLCAFATVWLMARTPRRRNWVLVAAFAASYSLFGLFLLRHGQGVQQLLCIPFFAFGLCAFLYRSRPSLGSAAHLAALAACVPVAFSFWHQRGQPVFAYQLPCLCALFAALFVLSGVGTITPRLRRWDRAMGDLSYPLYIGHGVILVLLSSLFASKRGWALYGLGVIASLALAKCLHLTAETPIRRIRDKVRGTPI